jgi:predicted permease
VKGLLRSLHSNFGFQPQNALLVDTDLDMAGHKSDSVPTMQRHMLDTLRTIPGVSSVALSDRLPLSLGWNTNGVFTDDTTDFRSSNAAAESTTFNISPDYFHTAETSLLSGRDITWHDDANSPRVAVVNREFVRKVFGPMDGAVGRYFKMDGKRIQIVGVVEDGKYKTLTEDPQPAMFLPILQSPTSSTVLLIRSNRDPQALAADVNRNLRALDRSMPFTVRTWPRELDSALFASRVATVALGVLGGLGVLLAGTGIFGVAAYSVSKRLREFGIRIALGAQRSQVVWSALSRALSLLALGSAVGVVLGVAGTGVLSYVVYQATPRDPVVLAGVIVTMVLLGALATWLPAYRALKADPLVLLREQ